MNLLWGRFGSPLRNSEPQEILDWSESHCTGLQFLTAKQDLFEYFGMQTSSESWGWLPMFHVFKGA
jgi:hypothetical protein